MFMSIYFELLVGFDRLLAKRARRYLRRGRFGYVYIVGVSGESLGMSEFVLA